MEKFKIERTEKTVYLEAYLDKIIMVKRITKAVLATKFDLNETITPQNLESSGIKLVFGVANEIGIVDHGSEDKEKLSEIFDWFEKFLFLAFKVGLKGQMDPEKMLALAVDPMPADEVFSYLSRAFLEMMINEKDCDEKYLKFIDRVFE